jgi:hypothetical protein
MALTPSQLNVFSILTAAIVNLTALRRFFFIEGEGGSGKTYLTNHFILWALKQSFKLAVCSTTGIASTLLVGGRTLHSTFNAPWFIKDDTPVPAWLLDYFRSIDVVIIDEATMMHKKLFEYIERCLRESMKNEKLFGGKMVVMEGDWRQCLVVVKGCAPITSYTACIKKSPLWENFTSLRLESNQRTGIGEEANEFRELLLKVGSLDPRIHTEVGRSYVTHLADKFFANSKKAMIEKVFPSDVIANPLKRWADMAWKAIVSPKRVTAKKVNEEINDRLPGDYHTYTASYDPEKIERSRKRRWSEVRDDDEELQGLAAERDTPNGEARYENHMFRKLLRFVDEEVDADLAEAGEWSDFDGIDRSRHPDPVLNVKVGSIMMATTTIKKLDGIGYKGALYNGIRVQVLSTEENRMRVRVLNLKGYDNLIAWIHRQHFKVRKETPTTPPQYMLQYPLRHAFAMTINKSQVGRCWAPPDTGQRRNFRDRPCDASASIWGRGSASRMGSCT